MKRGNWEVIGSQQKYKNNWIEVVEDKVISPSGVEGIYATLKIKDGISVLPIDDFGNVYLINEHRYPLDRMSLETVGGGRDGEEEYIECAKRELKEELGIEGEEWIDLGFGMPLPAYIDCPNRLFLVKKLSFGKQNTEDTELINVVKMTLEEAVQKVMNSEIFELKACTLILKAKEYLQSVKN